MKNISKLAMLCEEDGTKLKDDVELMLKMAEALDELDREEIINNGEPHFREDVLEKSFERDEMLKNAPSQKEGYIIVPKVVGE